MIVVLVSVWTQTGSQLLIAGIITGNCDLSTLMLVSLDLTRHTINMQDLEWWLQNLIPDLQQNTNEQE